MARRVEPLANLVEGTLLGDDDVDVDFDDDDDDNDVMLLANPCLRSILLLFFPLLEASILDTLYLFLRKLTKKYLGCIPLFYHYEQTSHTRYIQRRIAPHDNDVQL
jgi:hypothetical protein